MGRTTDHGVWSPCQQKFCCIVSESLSCDVLSTIRHGEHLHAVPRRWRCRRVDADAELLKHCFALCWGYRDICSGVPGSCWVELHSTAIHQLPPKSPQWDHFLCQLGHAFLEGCCLGHHTCRRSTGVRYIMCILFCGTCSQHNSIAQPHQC